MNLKGLAGIAAGLTAPPPSDLVDELTSAPAMPATLKPKAAKKLAKTRDPRYKRVMVLVKSNTEKKAYRKWEDAQPDKDFSDLVELLLSGYADGSIDV